MGALFDKISELFGIKKLTEAGVENAVVRKWIDETEKNDILGIETPVEDTVIETQE